MQVPGNFHVSAHAHYELAELYFDSKHPMNCSHHIHHLSYGEQPVDTSDIRSHRPIPWTAASV